MASSIIEVRDLVKIHARGGAQEVRALDGCTFTIARGEHVAIVGESGSGKTTLMHLLGALDRATSGDIEINGISLATATSHVLRDFRAREIGFIFQGFNLVPALDALENVTLAAHYARTPRSKALQRARLLLADVGLANRMHHTPARLSGGQQQRVAIARALINEPHIILADEPTGELDSQTAETILETLEQLHREQGVTLIIVTHSESVWTRAQRVIHLADGRVSKIEARARA